MAKGRIADHENHAEESGRHFWDLFALTENGHLKNTTLMYAFALSFLFIFIYGVAYFALLQPLDRMLAGNFSVRLVNIIESAVPSLAATTLCMCAFMIIQEKKIIPLAYAFVFVYAVVILVIILADQGTADPLLQVYLLFVPIPVIMGCAASALIYALNHKNGSMKKQ